MKINYLTATLLGLLVVVTMSPRSVRAEVQLVMFEEDSCAWCEAWHEAIGPIYGKTDESKIAPLRRVDIHAVRPDDLKSIKGVMYTPTFVLVEDGREVGRIIGYPGEDFFWSLLGELIGKSKTPVVPVASVQ